MREFSDNCGQPWPVNVRALTRPVDVVEVVVDEEGEEETEAPFLKEEYSLLALRRKKHPLLLQQVKNDPHLKTTLRLKLKKGLLKKLLVN